MFFFFGRNRPNKNSTSYIMSHYDLYDKFTTDRAAGAVNGTSAEPIGGVRAVTDTNSKISIGSGVLDFATGEAENDGVRWPVNTRVAGRTLISTITPSEASNGTPNMGWDTDTSGAITDAIRFAASGILAIRVQSAGNISAGAYTALSYETAVIMRAAGMFYFIKGGAFAKWTLVYISAVGSSSGYPTISSVGAYGVFTADNIRVPKRLFIPVPLQSDGFSASTTDGAGTPEANGPVGSVWTGATWAVGSGVVKNTPTVGAELLTDGGLENWNSPTDLTSWSEVIGGTSTVNQEATIKHSGTYSARLDVDASGTGVSIKQLYIGSPGQWWMTNWWGYSSASGKKMRMNIPSITSVVRDPGPTWTNFIETFRVAVGSNYIDLGRQAGESASSSLYFDDVSLKILTLSTLFRSLSHSSANVIVDADLTIVSGTQAGVVTNLDSAATPANFVIAYHDGTDCKLDKCVGGVYTNMISAAATYAAGATIRVIKDGSTYRLFYNSSAVGSAVTIADAGIVSNTLHGLFSTYQDNAIDNYRTWARGNEGQWEGLNNL